MASTCRALLAPALVLGLATFATAARADYTYAASGASFGSTLPFGMSFSPVSGSITDSATTTVTVANITYTPGATGVGSTTFGFTETFSGTPGTETIAFTGTYQYVATGSAINAGFTVTNESITGSGYTVLPLLVNYYSTSPTTATIQLTVIPNSVPEPASLAMLGLGLAGTLGLAARRRAARG